MDYLAQLQIERTKLWCRIYAEVLNKGTLSYLSTKEPRLLLASRAAALADQAIKDFDERFPKLENTNE